MRYGYGKKDGWKREDERSKAGGVRGGAGASLPGCRLAIQERRLSTSSRFKLTTINGIFLLSHSIRFPFSRLLLDCPSEAFSIGLRNNAPPPPPPPPLPHIDLYPPSSPASPSLHCFHFISSFRELSLLETGNNDLLHPEECPSPPSLLPPTPNNPPLLHGHPPNFLNLDKMRIPLSLWKMPHLQSCLHASIHSPSFTHLSFFYPLSVSHCPVLTNLLFCCSFSGCPLLGFEM